MPFKGKTFYRNKKLISHFNSCTIFRVVNCNIYVACSVCCFPESAV